MCVVLVRLDDVLSIDRVLDPTLDHHGHGLGHLVADHFAHPGSRQRFFLCIHLVVAFCARTVRTRAMSRRVLWIWLVFCNCCVAFCMRNEKCACWSSRSSFVSASRLWARISLTFIRISLCAQLPRCPADARQRSSSAAAWLQPARTPRAPALRLRRRVRTQHSRGAHRASWGG